MFYWRVLLATPPAFRLKKTFDWHHLICLLGGLYFLSSGSLALNQVQEYKLDQKMKRTAKRPVASGKIRPAAALILAIAFLFSGSELLGRVSIQCWALGIATVALYNGIYTYLWKPKWVFAAIPGAIPGALPVTIGYAANDVNLFGRDSVYLFLILFLWQMPHFWALAMRFKDDYKNAGVPTLPVALGVHRTLYHMGLWTYLYVVVALASPWFVQASWIYLLFVLPFAGMILWEFHRYYASNGEKRWFPFFMWVNVSVLIFMFVPVIDRWNFLFTKTN